MHSHPPEPVSHFLPTGLTSRPRARSSEPVDVGSRRVFPFHSFTPNLKAQSPPNFHTLSPPRHRSALRGAGDLQEGASVSF